MGCCSSKAESIPTPKVEHNNSAPPVSNTSSMELSVAVEENDYLYRINELKRACGGESHSGKKRRNAHRSSDYDRKEYNIVKMIEIIEKQKL